MIHKVFINFLPALLIFSALLSINIPVASAQKLDLIVCGEDKDNDGVLEKEEECDFYDLMKLARNLINALVIISTFLATGVFAYAGIRLLTSGTSSSGREYAKGVFWKVVRGYLWILFAWLIVYTITKVLLNKEFAFLLGAPGGN